MPDVHATFVASAARPFATAARSPVVFLRIATVAMVVMPRVVSIQHLSELIVEATTRWSARAVSGGCQSMIKRPSDLGEQRRCRSDLRALIARRRLTYAEHRDAEELWPT
jgi:hypothetical protein